MITGQTTTPEVDREAILDFIRSRRSTRSFDPTPLALEEIAQLIDIGRMAPSPSNRQPWKFISIADQGVKDAMREEVTRACQRLLEKQAGPEARAIEDYLKNFVYFSQAPVVIAVLIRRTNNRLAEAEASAIEIEGAHLAAGAAMQNILLAAVAMGLVACAMSGPMIARDELSAILGIEEPWTLMALIPVGRPGPDQPTSVPERKRLDLIWKHIPQAD